MGVKVRETPKGSGIWYVFVNHNGKRKSKKIGKNKRLAIEVARKLEAKLILGELEIEKNRPNCPTFKGYAETWLALPHDWKEGTKEEYEIKLHRYVYPIFGRARVDEIKRKDLKGFFDNLLIKGLKPNTLHTVKSPMTGIFSHAIDSELIEINPLQGLKLGKKKKRLNSKPLTEEEIGILLDQSKVYLNGIYYPSILFAIMTGARIGEIVALKWKDIDFENRLVEIKRSFRKGRLIDTKSGQVRKVDLTPLLTQSLKDLQVSQKRTALKNGRPYAEWVYANEKGEMLNYASFRYGLKQCLKKAGLRNISVHMLRHSYATIRLLRGHNIGDVSYQLGHSSIQTTYDIYTHWIPGEFKSEVDDLDKMQKSAHHPHVKDSEI